MKAEPEKRGVGETEKCSDFFHVPVSDSCSIMKGA